MRAIIQRHNRINGVTFAIVEFGLIALFIGTFATWYLLHRKVMMAIITWGITLNCVPVVVYGFYQLRMTAPPVTAAAHSGTRRRESTTSERIRTCSEIR